MEDVVVCKFGGSSLCEPLGLFNIKKIIDGHPKRKVVVVSAPGKGAFSKTKVTDLLIEAHTNKCVFNQNIIEVQKVFEKIAKLLNVDINLNKEFAKIRRNYKFSQNKSYLFSRGEFVMGKIMAKYLGFYFVDASKLIKFSKRGKILRKTYKNIVKITNKHAKVLIPGFYGSNLLGKIKVMSRGGSDITGAIITKAIKGSVYENWTDVDGVFSSNSKIGNNNYLLPEIDYSSIKYLSLFGATVINYKCSDLLDGHTTFIKNTFNPHVLGTKISNKPCNICAESKISCTQIIYKNSKRINRFIRQAKINFVFRYELDGFVHLFFTKSAGYFDAKKLAKVKKQVLLARDVVLLLSVENGKIKICRNNEQEGV